LLTQKLLWFIVEIGLGFIALVVAVNIGVVTEALKWCFQNVSESSKITVVLALILAIAYLGFKAVYQFNHTEKLKNKLSRIENDINQLRAEQKCHNEMVQKDIWGRPDQGGTPFVSMENRHARFISFVNLKGGPGKTTLASISQRASPL